MMQQKIQGILSKIARHQGQQAIKFLPFSGRTLSADGVWIPSWSVETDALATVEPIPREKFEQLGLDYSKNYIHVYSKFIIRDVRLQAAPDRIIWNGYVWSVESTEEWLEVNGWTLALCVSVTGIQQ